MDVSLYIHNSIQYGTKYYSDAHICGDYQFVGLLIENFLAYNQFLQSRKYR